MAALSGLFGSVIHLSGGTVNTVGMAEWSLDIGMSPAEVSAFGDTFRRKLASLREYSGNIAGNADTDASQATLRNAMIGGSVIGLRLYDSPTTYWSCGSVLLTNMGNQISVDGKGDRSFDFEGDGAVSYV